MSRDKVDDQTENTAPSLLQSRPQRQKGWRKRRTLSTVLLLVGAAIIVGTGIVLAVVLTPHGSSTTNNATTTNKVTPVTISNSNNPGKKGKNNCGRTVYLDTLFQQTTQGLHLSVAQVKAQIKGGKSIQDVASEQGVSAQQLQNIETSALQAANNQLVAMKCESQDQADARVQYYTSKSPQDMNANFTYWFATL